MKVMWSYELGREKEKNAYVLVGRCYLCYRSDLFCQDGYGD